MVANVNTVVTPIDKARQAAAEKAAPAKAVSGEGKPVPESGNSRPVAKPADFQESIQKTVEQISEFVSANARGLRFRVDDASGHTVVTVLNPNNGEIIRQIPSEEFLQIASELRRFGEAHFVDEEA